jgi:hypothetical protein
MTIMSLELPNHVSRLTEIGLETWAEEDRLLALRAAYEADRPDPTGYAMEVAQIFLEQTGVELEPSERAAKIEAWNPYSHRMWRVLQVVSRTLGSELGLSSKFYELVREDNTKLPKESTIIVTRSQSPEVSMLRGDWGLTADKPFYTEHHVTRNAALKNCLHVADAISGITESAADLGRPWTDALQEIRSLDEASIQAL